MFVIDVVLVPLLLNVKYFTPCSRVSIVNFEHVITGWDFVSPRKNETLAKNCLLNYVMPLIEVKVNVGSSHTI